MVKTLPFGGIRVPVPGFGAMGITSAMGTRLSAEQAEPVLLKAIELGCTFWDTAVAYDAGLNEKILGDFIRKHNVRDKVFETPLSESIAALDEIRKEGKTKYIGLSECSAKALREANSIAKVDAVQAEYSAFETLHEESGLIQTAKELDVAFVAFSPLGHGWLVDNFDYQSPDDFAPDDFRRTVPKFQGESFYKNKAIVDEMKKIATEKGCSLAQLALAWVAAQGLITIPGTTKPKRLEENRASRDVELSESEVLAIRKLVEANKPEGKRFSAMHEAAVGH
ncbi:aldo/keto reductase [Colletotrichum lupini]|uniref:Aldo/keto reductase n=1 Tax=Colletotrichum lupini TaxID=145971 RepID=A0A9Q8SP52_9PEZI|nr:aldo/keto reductase [Colletotrichum lupini]UQC80805.1 aldo/keto reductase [Colletotrichum lupini]